MRNFLALCVLIATAAAGVVTFIASESVWYALAAAVGTFVLGALAFPSTSAPGAGAAPTPQPRDEQSPGVALDGEVKLARPGALAAGLLHPLFRGSLDLRATKGRAVPGAHAIRVPVRTRGKDSVRIAEVCYVQPDHDSSAFLVRCTCGAGAGLDREVCVHMVAASLQSEGLEDWTTLNDAQASDSYIPELLEALCHADAELSEHWASLHSSLKGAAGHARWPLKD